MVEWATMDHFTIHTILLTILSAHRPPPPPPVDWRPSRSEVTTMAPAPCGCAAAGGHSDTGSDTDADDSALAGASHQDRLARHPYPMYVVRVADVLSMRAADGLPAHQQLRADGRARVWDGEGEVLFVSHVWVGSAHPDPHYGREYDPDADGGGGYLTRVSQFAALQRALAALARGEHETPHHPSVGPMHSLVVRTAAQWRALLAAPDTYVWLDWFCAPQPAVERGRAGERAARRQLRKAVAGLHTYIARAAQLLILAPPVQHESGARWCTYDAWLGRGWCRLEAAVHALAGSAARPTAPVLVQGGTGPRAVLVVPPAGISAPVGQGELTVESDRASVSAVLRAFLSRRIAALGSSVDEPGRGADGRRDELTRYRLLRAQRHVLLTGLPAPRDARDDPLSRLSAEEADWPGFAAALRLPGGERGVSARCESGFAPLHWAVMADRPHLVQGLLARGADPNAERTGDLAKGLAMVYLKALTGAPLARGFNDEHSLMLFMDTVRPLDIACAFASGAVVRALLHARADAHQLSVVSGGTALSWAAATGNVEAIHELFAHLGPAYAAFPPVLAGTAHRAPLIATLSGQSGALRLLVQSGAPVLSEKTVGEHHMRVSELHAAALCGMHDVLYDLLQLPSARAYLSHLPRANLCARPAPAPRAPCARARVHCQRARARRIPRTQAEAQHGAPLPRHRGRVAGAGPARAHV